MERRKINLNKCTNPNNHNNTETNAYGVESSRKSQNDSSNAEKEFNW